MFLLGKDGQIIKRIQFENNGCQSVTYDFNEKYHCMRSAQFIEDEGTFRNQCYKVISFESQEEVLSIPYCDRNHIETLFLAGDFLFTRDYGKFDIYDLKTGELIKRVLANAESGGKNIDGKIYAYDYSHESNWCSDSFVCAFALKDDLTFDYSDSVTSSEINDADSNARVRCRVDVEENEDAYTVSVESYGGMRGEVSFDVNEEDYFFAGSYYHKGFFCYSYHENGIMRKIDLRTGEILEFGYEKIDLEKYRISPWIDDIDEDETDIVCNDFFGKVFDLEERASGKQRFLVLSINLTTGESNKLVLSSKPKEFIFTPSTIVYYDELMERIEIVKNGGINKHFKGKIITAIGDDLYIDSLENPEYLSGIRYLDRISCIDFSVAKNIFHNEKFPEIDSDIFQVNIDSMPMYWYSSMVDSVQWIRDPQIIYQDRTLHFGAGGDFYNYLYETKPCPTFSIKMIDQGTETITFEIVNTRGDRFGENLSGVFYLMGWGHERYTYKDELKEAAPIYSRFSESIEITDLKFGEKKLLTFRLPERGSVLLSSDFEYFRGLKDSREDLEFVRLEFLSNGVIDVLESELMPSNYYNRSRFGYVSGYEDFIKTQTIWPIRNH